MYSDLVTKKSGKGFSLTNGNPISVPNDFFGLCLMRGPDGSGSQESDSHVGILNVKSVRMNQQHGTRWNQIETSDGVFDFTNLDIAITFARQNGLTVYWGLYGTPRFYADNITPRPTITDFNAVGPWGTFAEGAMPIDLSKVDRFIRTVITRYNSSTGAWRLANPTLGKGIQYFEPWNEPIARTTNANSTTSFWFDTQEKMVDLTHVSIAACKSTDPSVLCSTPGFTHIDPAIEFLNATGTLTGVIGKNIPFDEFAWHPYTHMPVGYPRYSATGATVYDQYINNGVNGVKTMKSALNAIGVNLPLVISEVGYDGQSTNSNMIAWMAEPPEFRYLWWLQWMMACAALEIKRVYFWHWGYRQPQHTLSTSGFWQTDVNGVRKAGNDIANHVCGKTIIDDSFSSPKYAYLKFSNGSSIEVSPTKTVILAS